MFWPAGRHGYGPPPATDLGLIRAPDGGRLWSVHEGRHAGHRVVSYQFNQISGLALMIPTYDDEARRFALDTLPNHLQPESIDDVNMLAWFREVGWPMKALTCSIHWETQISNADILYRVEGGIQLPRDREFNPRALPLRPIWLGLTANSCLYGLVWLTLSAGIVRLRESRRRAGRCICCGYPRIGLQEDSRCPECGR